MTKTLLFLNGQPVILTSDDADSVVQDNPSNSGREQHDSIKSLFNQHEEKDSLERKLGELEGLGETVHPNLVQVKVHGRDVPGFMLSEGGAGGLHKILAQSVQKGDYGLHILSSEKVSTQEEAEKAMRMEDGDFLHLHNATLQSAVGKECSFASQAEENYGNDVFALTANSELLQPSVEEGAVENGSHRDSSLQGLQNIVQLPLVSGHLGVRNAESGHSKVIQVRKDKQVIQMSAEQTQGVQVEGEQSQMIQIGGEQNQVIQMSPEQSQVIQMPGEASQVIKMEGEQGQVAGRSMQTIIAIIQGEDGSTQTIELSPEDASKLNLPQIFNGNTETQEALCQLPGSIEIPVTKPLTEEAKQKQELSGCCGGVLEDGAIFPGNPNVEISSNSTADDPGGDGDVSLGPFLLIPEYNADGTISMLQIRGSDSDAAPEPSSERMNPNSVSVEEAQPELVRTVAEKPSLPFPRPGQNVQKIRLPLNQPNKKLSLLKPKPVDLKSIAAKPTAPKVPGSMYLRDIAMRTKFRNLTSFLDTKPTDQELEDVKRSIHNTELPARAVPHSDIMQLNSSSILTGKTNVPSSSEMLQSDLGSSGGSCSNQAVVSQKDDPLKQVVHNIRPVKKELNPVKEDSALLQFSQLASCSPSISPEVLPVSGGTGDRALTIKVSTGSIFVSGANDVVTSSTPSVVPSIKCTADDPLS